MIDKFTNEYMFLSNFCPGIIEFNGWTWATVEHAYQAHKTLDTDDRAHIQSLNKAGKAKRHGRHVELRCDWEEIKMSLMLELVFVKFTTYDFFDKKLRSTKNEFIVEGNNWHDNEWGDCHCVKCQNIEGKNKLGKILMDVRRMILFDGRNMGYIDG